MWLCAHVSCLPQGMAYIDSWGNLRYVANQAFMGLLHNKLYPDQTHRATVYACFARKQARIMLGETGPSYVVSCCGGVCMDCMSPFHAMPSDVIIAHPHWVITVLCWHKAQCALPPDTGDLCCPLANSPLMLYRGQACRCHMQRIDRSRFAHNGNSASLFVEHSI